MKKLLLLVSSLLMLIFLSGYNTVTTDRILELPEQPFDYSVEIPNFFNDPQDGGGYSTSLPIDADKLAFLDNDISTLGRVLFYDTQLSATEDIACATCHLQENSFAEPKQFSDGALMMSESNSMHLNDLGWSNDGFFLWDMHITELSEVVKIPFMLDNELGQAEDKLIEKITELGYYDELFEKAYGSSESSMDKVSEAITQFISSINTFNSTFDQRAVNDFNEMTEEEILGMEIFDQNCSICHKQGTLQIFDQSIFDQMQFSNGIDLEDSDIGAGMWDENMTGAFKKTTLRNWKYTAPYMHDGRFETMEEILDHYDGSDNENEEWGNNIFLSVANLNESDKTPLLAFLETLNDSTLLTNEKWSDPFSEISNTQLVGDVTLEGNIFPNPSSDIVNISFDNPTGDLGLVEVFENSGRLILKEMTSSDSYRITQSRLSQGNYHVKVTLNGKVFSGGFVYE